MSRKFLNRVRSKITLLKLLSRKFLNHIKTEIKLWIFCWVLPPRGLANAPYALDNKELTQGYPFLKQILTEDVVA